jgi:hypothetical protein
MASSQSEPEAVAQPQKEIWTAPGHERSRSEAEHSHKRKRSNSIEVRKEQPIQEPTPVTATVPNERDSRDPFDNSQREYRQGSDDRDRESWYTRDERSHYESRQGSATEGQSHLDEQIGETLRRANDDMDHGEYSNHPSPDDDDRSMSMYPYTPDRGDSILQHDPKKRKRNFSNRTKTGCLTCRKRKKKCDELKPECKSQPQLIVCPIWLA